MRRGAAVSLMPSRENDCWRDGTTETMKTQFEDVSQKMCRVLNFGGESVKGGEDARLSLLDSRLEMKLKLFCPKNNQSDNYQAVAVTQTVFVILSMMDGMFMICRDQ